MINEESLSVEEAGGPGVKLCFICRGPHLARFCGSRLKNVTGAMGRTGVAPEGHPQGGEEAGDGGRAPREEQPEAVQDLCRGYQPSSRRHKTADPSLRAKQDIEGRIFDE